MEQEANQAAGEVDLELEETLEQFDEGFEAEEKTFAEELMDMPKFCGEKTDDQKMAVYALAKQKVTPTLRRQLEAYVLHRTATFAARRCGVSHPRVRVLLAPAASTPPHPRTIPDLARQDGRSGGLHLRRGRQGQPPPLPWCAHASPPIANTRPTCTAWLRQATSSG